MTTKSRLLLAAAFLAVLLSGFGLARLFDPHGDAATSATQHDDEHAADGDSHDDHAEGADAHDDHGDEGDAGHDDDEPEEGVVTLTQAQIDASGIGIVAVGRGGGALTRLSGRVEPTVAARAAVAATIAGRVERVLVAPGVAVEAGSPLAVIISGEAATLRAATDAAVAEAEAARFVLRRDQALVEQGVVAKQELEASRARSLAADAMARAARARSEATGVADAAGRLTITSPFAGVVGAVPAMPGAFVNAGDVVANVVDSRQTELVFTAPPAIASQVAPGMRIEVAAAAGNFAAEITGAAADVREQGGMALIRARPTTGSLPPAGSAVSGTVVMGGDTGALNVPAEAVQTVDGRSVVFVAHDGGFRATPVLAGRNAGRSIEILNGLTGDERIAGSNAFLLKAELAKGEADHGH